MGSELAVERGLIALEGAGPVVSKPGGREGNVKSFLSTEMLSLESSPCDLYTQTKFGAGLLQGTLQWVYTGVLLRSLETWVQILHNHWAAVSFEGMTEVF